MSIAHDDQLDAAVAETRTMVERAFDVGDDHKPGAGRSTVVDELWDRMKGAPRCEHLAKTPAQPWMINLSDPVWSCQKCHARRSRKLQATGLGPIEEHTCDRCRLYSPGLEPVMLRQDLWLMLGAFCAGCMARVLAAGGRMVEAR